MVIALAKFFNLQSNQDFRWSSSRLFLVIVAVDDGE